MASHDQDRSAAESVRAVGLKDLPEVVGGRFKRISFLGLGGCSMLWLARDLSGGERVALKVLGGEGARAYPWLVSRFLREPEVWARIGNPSFRRVLTGGTDESGLRYVAMEYLEGEDLGDLIQRQGPLAMTEAVTIGLEAARALSSMHAKGMVHRDIKPENIFLVAEGGGLKAFMLDLDSVRLPEDNDEDMLALRHTMGTKEYMAPEQFSTPQVGPAADIYALGACLFEMLVGRPPYIGSAREIFRRSILGAPPPVRAFRRGAPIELDMLIYSMLSAAPAERPGIYRVTIELQRCLAALEQPTGPP